MSKRWIIPVAVSARHVHLSEATIETLFGKGYRLAVGTPLSQPGQFAAVETVRLIGASGRLEHVRIVGPPRDDDQIEISRSDELLLGLDAPVRVSGDLMGTPGITLEGPAGRVDLPRGVVCARRHVHMSPEDAAHLGLNGGDNVRVSIDSAGRDLVFGDVLVRVARDAWLELHLDTDEGNAAGVVTGDRAELILHPGSRDT